MIRVHLWSWVKCAWFWAWRPVAIVRAMRHLTLVATLACGAITVIPPAPPVEAHGPPPVLEAPPPVEWSFPPPWVAMPPAEAPSGVYIPGGPIPLTPVLEAPGGPEETFGAPPFEVASLPPLCPPETAPVSTHPVPEPAGLALIGFALLTLGAILAVRRSPPVVPSVRVTILTERETL